MTDNVRVITHSCIRIESADPHRVIYFDPFSLKEEMNDADIIFVTHDHWDHFSPKDIKKAAKKETVLVVPERMKSKVSGMDLEVVPVAAGDDKCVNGISFLAVPSYNVGKLFHPKAAGWLGYVAVIDGKKYYVAGDTDINGDVRKVRCDVAIVPIGGTFTMNAAEAARLVNEIRPEAAIPSHYGSVAGTKSDAKAFAEAVSEDIQVVEKTEFF